MKISFRLLSLSLVAVSGWMSPSTPRQSLHGRSLLPWPASSLPVPNKKTTTTPLWTSRTSPSTNSVVDNTLQLEQGHDHYLARPTTTSTATTTTTTSEETRTLFQPLLDFTKPETIEKIDRLDDVIMGGISTSSVLYHQRSTFSSSNNNNNNINSSSTKEEQDSKDESMMGYAKWFGVCREDGGGFCGWRTNPFREALAVAPKANINNNTNNNNDDIENAGFYVVCKLASDDDANRRVWKLSTRTRPDRGEQLYQAPVQVPNPSSVRRRRTTSTSTTTTTTTTTTSADDDDGWSTVKVPFSSFRLVRGPRAVEGAPPLNVTGGIYQIGMTMSKFAFATSGAVTTTNATTTDVRTEGGLQELENFRPGFFQLDLKEIGVYYTEKDEQQQQQQQPMEDLKAAMQVVVVEPQVMTREESKQKRPLLIKILVPLAKLLFFSEASQRRKSAMKLLQQKRGLSRLQAIQFGLSSRARSYGLLRSVCQTCGILAIDSFRLMLSLTVRLVLVYPLRITSAFARWVQNFRTPRVSKNEAFRTSPTTRSTSSS